MSIWQLVRVGGFTMYLLIVFSILSLTIIIERVWYYHRRSKIQQKAFMAAVRKEVEVGNIRGALEVSKGVDAPFASVVYSGLSFYGHDEKVISNNMDREIVVETTLLEKYTAIVGTIGSIAVYIGLFGTVLGIIRAFRDIATSNAGGVSVVINGISEALVCTAAGLCVAVPAVIAYNFFIKKIDNFIKDMELSASEMMDLMTIKKR